MIGGDNDSRPIILNPRQKGGKRCIKLSKMVIYLRAIDTKHMCQGVQLRPIRIDIFSSRLFTQNVMDALEAV